MKSAIQRFFLVFLSAWLLLGHVGFAYQISNCLVTGKKELTWAAPAASPSSSTSKETRISRAACYQYAQVQVKFTFDQQVKKNLKYVLEAQPLVLLDYPPSTSVAYTFSERDQPIIECTYCRPLPEQLAFMQRYNI